MKSILFASFLSLFLVGHVQGSAEVCIDHEKNQVTVTAHYFFYGDEAKERVARDCIAEINRLFNNGTTSQFNKYGPFRNLNFNITYSVHSEDDVLKKMVFNTEAKNNFVRIDLPPKGSRVVISEHALKGNFGYFHIGNNLGTSTTCAHEFGHGLGLNHPQPCNFIGKGAPPIMAERGCLVDAKYQWDPKVMAGAQGGTINPIYRTVSPREMMELNLGDLSYAFKDQKTECAELGRALDRYYEKNGDRITPPQAQFYKLMQEVRYN